MIDEQREFWSKVAAAYDSVVDLQIGANNRAVLRARLAQEGNLGRAIEFGCGTGFYSEVLASKADSLVATDIAPGMLALAKQRIKANNLTFQQADCQNTSLPDSAFDTAFLSLVLHFTEPTLTLSEMRRILKTGGTLLVCNLDPDALSPLNRLRCRLRVIYYGLTRYRTKPPRKFGKNVLSGSQLCKLLVQTGFAVISMETFRSQFGRLDVPIEFIKAIKR